MAGDGRHDSMGHSAKYCAYSIFCCTIPVILHFALVQVSVQSFTYMLCVPISPTYSRYQHNSHCVFCTFLFVQRNEVGSSTAMEYEGFQSCINYLLCTGLVISTFVSDRHKSIAKHMRQNLKNITHYFDLWHLKKSEYL